MEYSIIEKLKPNYLNKSELIDNILIVKNQKCKLKKGIFKFNFLKNIIHSKNLIKIKQDILKSIEWKENLKVLILSIKKGKVLECFPKNIDRKNLDIVAIDRNLKNLLYVNDKYSQDFSLSLMKCCAETLPFLDNIYDVVLFIDGIYDYSNKKQIVKEILRVAKDGARVVIFDKFTLENEYEIENLQNEILKYVYECNLNYLNHHFCLDFNKD